MARIKYEEDPRTGERVVRTAEPGGAGEGAVYGQCDCGASVRLPLNGNAVECGECGAVYRAAIPERLEEA